jgi:putative OPT family oligopeptide transporter
LEQQSSVKPLYSADQKLPELTFKALILGIVLTLILTAANAYLGLKVGATVSASIPAAVISLGFLRLFRHHNVLESTMVQTAASAGEGLVSGIAFILPAMLVLGLWQGFHYWETVYVGLIGGVFGVLFSIPIRRALLNNPELRFPEGVAIGNVLKASVAQEADDLKMLVVGGVVGAVISLFQTGFRVVSDSFEVWWRGTHSLFGIGAGFSPALIAAGYIVGLNVGISMFVGVVIGWIVGVPVLTHFYGIPAGDAMDAAGSLWNDHMRYLGVGTMLVGGLWTLVCLFRPVMRSLKTSWDAVTHTKRGGASVLRTEKDIPLNYVLWFIVLSFVPCVLFALHVLDPHTLPLSSNIRWVMALFSAVYIVVVGFAFSSIAGYFAGLIGSSNSPGSGLIVSILLFLSLALVAILSLDVGFDSQATGAQLLTAGFAILITAVIGSALVITNETVQDLKVGQIVGATPWKQQLMMVLGLAVAALIIPLVLELLFNGYGMAGVFPRPGMDPSQMLAAPQAGLMAAIAKGAFTHNLPWTMIFVGCIIASVCIVVDELLKPRGYRLPVLAVGIGIYLPMDASIPVLFGGILHYIVNRHYCKVQAGDNSLATKKQVAKGRHRGLTLACGLVAGSSLMGVVLAIPFTIFKSANVLSLVGPGFLPYANMLGVVVTLVLCAWIFKVVTKRS